MVSMAIPDHRTCFDFFPIDDVDFTDRRLGPRSNGRHDAELPPSPPCGTTITVQVSAPPFLRDAPVSQVVGPTNLRAVYDELMDRINASNEYLDTHRSAFTRGIV